MESLKIDAFIDPILNYINAVEKIKNTLTRHIKLKNIIPGCYWRLLEGIKRRNKPDIHQHILRP